MTVSLSTPAGHHYSPEVLSPRCYVQGVRSEVLDQRSVPSALRVRRVRRVDAQSQYL